MKIVICDDNEHFRNTINMLVEKYITKHNFNMEIALSTSEYKDVLDYINKTKDNNIYLLDVNLAIDNYNGFELAKDIRKSDADGFIIFITTHEELLSETFKYRVEALDYIVKDSDGPGKKLEECLLLIDKRVELRKEENEKYFNVSIGSITHKFLHDEIIFFETSYNKHKIILHTTDSQIEFSGSLGSIEDELGSDFIRTHRSFLVNKAKIKKIDKLNNQVLLSNNHIALVSRKMKRII